MRLVEGLSAQFGRPHTSACASLAEPTSTGPLPPGSTILRFGTTLGGPVVAASVRAAGSYKAYRARPAPLVALRRLCAGGRAGAHGLPGSPPAADAAAGAAGEDADSGGARREHRAHRAPRRHLPDDPASTAARPSAGPRVRAERRSAEPRERRRCNTNDKTNNIKLTTTARLPGQPPAPHPPTPARRRALPS